jgi:hypothetical protein
LLIRVGGAGDELVAHEALGASTLMEKRGFSDTEISLTGKRLRKLADDKAAETFSHLNLRE